MRVASVGGGGGHVNLRRAQATSCTPPRARGAPAGYLPSMRVTYHGELDAFTGSIRQQAADPAGLGADLQLLVIFSDVVIVPPGNLLDHAPTLPACEALVVASLAVELHTQPAQPEARRLSHVGDLGHGQHRQQLADFALEHRKSS